MAARSRIPTREARERVVDATRALLEEQGAAALNVSAIAERADVNRTVFYRHFDGVYPAVAAVLERLAERQAAGAGAWFRDLAAVGTREVVFANVLRGARTLQPNAKLMCAIVDAAGRDDDLRVAWRDRFVRPRVDATAAAIRRDQAAGAVRLDLDPEDTALALQTMGINLALEMLGREGGEPEQVARVVAPIWEAVLFGPPTTTVNPPASAR